MDYLGVWLLHGIQPLQQGVIGNEIKKITQQIIAEGIYHPFDGESYFFNHHVGALSLGNGLGLR